MSGPSTEIGKAAGGQAYGRGSGIWFEHVRFEVSIQYANRNVK